VGLLLGLLILPAAAWFYLHSSKVPVAATDPPMPFESELVQGPLQARIAREMPDKSPMEASSANLEIGAHIYRQQCAACHGLYGRPSSFGKSMFPKTPQLWEPHGNGVVGVSDDPVGETYWKVANGIRLSGMPSYRGVLNETQMWQVSLLLAGADKPLPADVLTLLKQPLDFDPPVPGAVPAPASNPLQGLTRGSTPGSLP
jgi:mono/diheme cytochrome c family protein